jgi:hypothetical protein
VVSMLDCGSSEPGSIPGDGNGVYMAPIPSY